MWYVEKEASVHRNANNTVTSLGWVRASRPETPLCDAACSWARDALLWLCISPALELFSSRSLHSPRGNFDNSLKPHLLSSVRFFILRPDQLLPYNITSFWFWLDICKLPHIFPSLDRRELPIELLYWSLWSPTSIYSVTDRSIQRNVMWWYADLRKMLKMGKSELSSWLSSLKKIQGEVQGCLSSRTWWNVNGGMWVR